MNTKYIILPPLLALSSLSAGLHAETPVAYKQVEALMRCYNDNVDQRECRVNLANQFDTPFARVERGYALLFEDKKKSVEDFQWAANQGYPPAYSAMSIATRDDPKVSFEWLMKSVEHGMAGGAKYYLRSAYVGSSLKESEDLTLFAMMGCHPAAFRDTNVIYNLWELGKGKGITDLNELIEINRLNNKAQSDEQMKSFLNSCRYNNYYFGYYRPKGQVDAGLKRARQRMAKALNNIKAAVEKFPELRILSRTEYLDSALEP
jgi:hypothetical protein